MKIEIFDFITAFYYSDKTSDITIISLEKGALHHINSIIKDRNTNAEIEILKDSLKIKNVYYGEVKFAIKVFLTLWNSLKDFR